MNLESLILVLGLTETDMQKKDLFTILNNPSQLVYIHIKGWNDQEETNLTLSQKVPGQVLGAKHRKQTILQSSSLILVMKQSHSIHIIYEVSLGR